MIEAFLYSVGFVLFITFLVALIGMAISMAVVDAHKGILKNRLDYEVELQKELTKGSEHFGR